VYVEIIRKHYHRITFSHLMITSPLIQCRGTDVGEDDSIMFGTEFDRLVARFLFCTIKIVLTFLVLAVP